MTNAFVYCWTDHEVAKKMLGHPSWIKDGTREKMRKAKVGIKLTDSHRNSLRQAHINRSEESEQIRKEKIRNTMKNNKKISQQIMLGDIFYPSISEAMRMTGRSQYWITKRAVRL